MKSETVRKKNGLRINSIIRSLRHRNFRLFFLGQGISLIGTWMQTVALGWLVYRLTNSAFMLGLAGFAGQIPAFIFAPFAGVLADRWKRHGILVVTQSLAMIQAFILSLLVLTGIITIWEVIVLSVLLGMINAFDMPTRQSFMVEMIDDKNDLGNAIALNSSIVTGARLLGPMIAGMLISVTGEGSCFLINAISYIAALIALLLMKITKEELTTQRSKAWHELKEGVKYAFDFKPIRSILLMFALVNLMGMPYIVLMPIFARDILHGGPDAYGFLMGCSGMGALAGALYLASRESVLGLGKMIPRAAGIFGLGLAAFSFSRIMGLSMALMLMAGFGQIVQMASCNTLLQTIVDDTKRGRVMSFYVMAFMGATPVGSLISGSLATKIGAPWTVFIGGTACVIGAAIFLKNLPELRKMVRPIYITKGIISETPLDIPSAADLSPPDNSKNDH